VARTELNFPRPAEEESIGDRLKDKVALVSGAGSSGPGWGNGKATAVLFAREGAKVLAADINRDAALETKRMIMLAQAIHRFFDEQGFLGQYADHHRL